MHGKSATAGAARRREPLPRPATVPPRAGCGSRPSMRSISRSRATRRASLRYSCTAARAPVRTRRSRRFFDPRRYRIVVFDQRGCGRSRPHASLDDNTTWHLVADMELLRRHLGIERWLVFGGSWGSTLALAYAQTHPTAVTELVLRGIFMLRKWEIDWFYQEGASALVPGPLGAVRRAHTAARARRPACVRFHRRLTSRNRARQLEAARAWSVWEAATSFLRTDESQIRKWGDDRFAIADRADRVSLFREQGIPRREDQLLRDVRRIRHIPARHRPGPLRRCLSDAHRMGPAPRLARGRLPPGRRCGTLRARARHHARARRGHQSFRPPISRLQTAFPVVS